MKIVPAAEFRQRCLALIDEIGKTGETIVLTKRGRPVAELTAVPAGRRDDWRGALQHSGKIIGDVVAPVADAGEWAALSV